MPRKTREPMEQPVPDATNDDVVAAVVANTAALQDDVTDRIEEVLAEAKKNTLGLGILISTDLDRE